MQQVCGGKYMYGYVTEYCSPYRQMMPVEYEKQSDGQYHKVKMACGKVESGECDGVSCAHFQAAPEIEEQWKLRKVKL